MPFDSFLTHLQNTGDLIVQELLQVAQDNELAVVHSQPPEGLPHQAALLLSVAQFFRRAGRIAVRVLSNKGLIVMPQGLTATTVATHFQAFVGRNSVKPGLDGGLYPEVRQPFESGDENVLGHLLRSVPIKQMTVTVAQNRP